MKILIKDLGKGSYGGGNPNITESNLVLLNDGNSSAVNNITEIPNRSYLDLQDLPNLDGNIEFYVDFTSFPATGVADVLYVAKDTRTTYTWTGSTYETTAGGVATNVEFYADVASLPATGTVDTLYVAKAEDTLHEWNGSSYDQLGGGSGGSNVEFYADVASLPATGTVDTLYIAKAEDTLHEWNGSSYDQLTTTIVSTDADNAITAGGDGGAYLNTDHSDAMVASTLNYQLDAYFLNEVVDSTDFETRANATGKDIVLARFTTGAINIYIRKPALDSALNHSVIGNNLHLRVSNSTLYEDMTTTGLSFSGVYLNSQYKGDWWGFGKKSALNFGVLTSLPDSDAKAFATPADTFRMYDSELALPTTGYQSTLYYIRSTNALKGWDGSQYVDIGGSAPTIVSTDANNAITAGGDGGAFLDTSSLSNVIFVATEASLPYPGVADTIYVTRSDHQLFEWNEGEYGYDDLGKESLNHISIDSRNNITTGSDGKLYFQDDYDLPEAWQNLLLRGRYVSDVAHDFSDIGTKLDGFTAQSIFYMKTTTSLHRVAVRVADFTNIGIAGKTVAALARIQKNTRWVLGHSYYKFNILTLINTVQGYEIYTWSDGAQSNNLDEFVDGAECSFYIQDSIESASGGGATIVSTDADNAITAGGDGGAFLDTSTLGENNNVVFSINESNLPGIGEVDTLYVCKLENTFYEWDGSNYERLNNFDSVLYGASVMDAFYLHDVANDESDLISRIGAQTWREFYVYKKLNNSFGVAVNNSSGVDAEGMVFGFAVSTGLSDYGVGKHHIKSATPVSGPGTVVGDYTYYDLSNVSYTLDNVDGDRLAFAYLTRVAEGSGGGATIVSTDADNGITAGGDGGAYLNTDNYISLIEGFMNVQLKASFINNIVDSADFLSRADATGSDIVLGRFTNTNTKMWVKKSALDSSLAHSIIGNNVHIRISESTSSPTVTRGGLTYTAAYLSDVYAASAWWELGFERKINTGLDNSNPDSDAQVFITPADTYRLYKNEADLPATGYESTLYYIRSTNALKGWDGSQYVDIGGGGVGSYGESDVVNTSRQYTKQQNFAQQTLTDAATLSWDFDTAQTAILTATSGVGNVRTLPNSVISAGVDGGNYQLTFVQDATGGRRINFESNFNVVGSFDLAANRRTLVTIVVQGTEADVIISPVIDPEKPEALTGTVLDLSKYFGNTYNYASPLSDATYTFQNPVVNGFARVYINAPSEPTVTGATKIYGDDFVASTTMEMIVESPDGINADYYFIQRT
jgi:hypothetical protein